MDIKTYLNRAYILSKSIEHDKLQRQAAIEKATDISPHLSEDKVQTSRSTESTMSVMMSIALDLEEKIKKQETEFEIAKTEIETTINTIDDTEIRHVLKLRYLCFYSWEEIAAQCYCSEATVYRLHRRGLKKLTVRDS